MLTPLLFMLYIHDWIPRHRENYCEIVNDIMIISQITNSDESSYQERIADLSFWCTENNPLLNINNTKEISVDFRETEPERHPCLLQRG